MLVLGFPNHLESPTYPPTLTGGSWLAGMPLERMLTQQMADVATSTDLLLASTQWDTDFGAPVNIKLLAIHAHNISRAGLIRRRVSNVAGDFSAPVYDSGWVDVWDDVYGVGGVPWGHPGLWDGKLTQDDIRDYHLGWRRTLDVEVLGQYVRTEIDDTTNPAGFISIGRDFITPGWVPKYNMSAGAGLGWVPNTTLRRSPGGTMFSDRRRPWRTVRFAIGDLPEVEAMYSAFEMQRILGIDLQVYFAWSTTDTHHAHRRSFPGTLRELSLLEFPRFNGVDTVYQLDESV